jgi:phenylacetyl-CoA:acceptor oxidoreductase subunit 2
LTGGHGRQQRHWDVRAALNFILGGAGSGLLVVLGLAGGASPAAIALALALVAAGLFSVWMEIGRKLRALHVLFNPFTSWMTRESFVAVLLFPLGLGAIYVPGALWAAALAGFAFLFCQARILHAAKGVPAWRAPEVVPLVVATGLAEGAGLALLFSQQGLLVALFVAAVIARYAAWRRYRAAALELRGTLVALALVAAGFVAREALFAAALVALAGGWWLKLALVTRAAATQELTLPRLPVRGAR